MNDDAQKLYNEYQKEFDDLHDKYREDYIISQEDIDNSHNDRFKQNNKVGDKTSKNPTIPPEPEKAYDLFKNYYAALHLSICKQIHIQDYQSWTLDNVENEISEIEDFIKSANQIIFNPEKVSALNTGNYQHIEIKEYLKFKSGYYDHHLMTWEQCSANSTSAMIYGKYILFCNFLNDKRTKLLAIKKEQAFSKQSSLKQLD